jgi:Caspase domain
LSVYALLVGIDKYYPQATDLRGCCRDVDSALMRLSSCVPEGFHPLVLKDAEASRAAVIDGFRTHLGAAGPGDKALFWFSGHGSQVPAPPEFKRLESTGMMQTILCADSRKDAVPDLLDKEIGILISEVASRDVHVVVILDCCHADGASRVAPAEEQLHPPTEALGVRAEPALIEAPAASSLLPELRDLLAGGAARPGLGQFPIADHVSLAACHSNQVAHEVPAENGHRGLFSLALLSQLVDHEVSYRELIARTRCFVESAVPRQLPVLFPTDTALADQPFLGGELRPPASTLTMRFTRGDWSVDAGACHGLEAGTAEDPTRLGVLRADPPKEVRIVRVLADRSVVEPIGWDPGDPGPDKHYPLVVTRVPLPAATVAIVENGPVEPARLLGPVDAGMAALVSDAISGAGRGVGPSPHVRLVGQSDPAALAELRIVSPGPGIVRVLGSDDSPLLPDAPCGSSEDAARLVGELEHVARWRRIRSLENPLSGIAGAIQIEVVAARPGELVDPRTRDPLRPDRSGKVRLLYQHSPDGWVAPEIFIRLRNTTDRHLYCVLLDLTDRFRMHPNLFPGGWIAPKFAASAAEGKLIKMTLPPGRQPTGGALGTDWLKVLAAEEPFSSEPFRLPRLGEPGATVPRVRSDALSGVVDRLGFQTMFRDLDVAEPRAQDWSTGILTLVTRIPGQTR